MGRKGRREKRDKRRGKEGEREDGQKEGKSAMDLCVNGHLDRTQITTGKREIASGREVAFQARVTSFFLQSPSPSQGTTLEVPSHL